MQMFDVYKLFCACLNQGFISRLECCCSIESCTIHLHHKKKLFIKIKQNAPSTFCYSLTWFNPSKKRWGNGMEDSAIHPVQSEFLTCTSFDGGRGDRCSICYWCLGFVGKVEMTVSGYRNTSEMLRFWKETQVNPLLLNPPPEILCFEGEVIATCCVNFSRKFMHLMDGFGRSQKTEVKTTTPQALPAWWVAKLISTPGKGAVTSYPHLEIPFNSSRADLGNWRFEAWHLKMM